MNLIRFDHTFSIEDKFPKEGIDTEKDIRQPLEKLGYTVFITHIMKRGIPDSILVGKEKAKIYDLELIQSEFFRFMDKLGLRYSEYKGLYKGKEKL